MSRSLPLLHHLSAENGRPALVFPDQVLSYAELHRRVERLLARMAASTGGTRQLVALEAQASVDFIVTYLACLKAGHAMALLPPGDSQAAEVFRRDFRPGLSFGLHDGRWRMTGDTARAERGLHPDLAVMLATSGSEGRPRWVRLSRAALEANAQSIAAYLGLTAEDRAPHTLPFHYSYGLSVLNAHLCAGGSLAFCAGSVVDPGFIEQAAALGCTGLSGVPFTFELLERIGFRQRLWPDLRYMTVAGGRMPPALVAQYHEALAAKGAAFFVMYGQTEATARMAYVPPHLAATHPDCIGIAIPGGRLRIAGETGNTISAPGEAGELFYAGPNVMMGYATTRSDLARGHDITELATGDIASLTPAGLIRLEGRARRFSKLAGLRIGHEAIEWALRERGIACAVTGDDASITIHIETGEPEKAILWAAEAAAIPARYLRCERHAALPRLASGKIDYAALAPPPAPAAAKPGTSRSLLDDFRATFYPKPVSAGDSFASLEGDSLAYVQASLAVENRLGFLPEGWETISVARLERLAGSRPGATPGLTVRVESHIVLRAAAILLIMLHHATEWPIPGGAMTLMMLVGYGFARFHREALFAGRSGAVLLPMLRNLLPYFAVVMGFAIAWGQVPWASLFLIGNLGFADPGAHSMLPFQYWFVEAYVQLCLITAGAFSLRWLRAGARRHPFGWALALMLFAFTLRYTVPLVYDIGLRKIFLVTYVLWLPLLGWCAFFARSLWQKLALAACLAVLAPYAAYYGGNWTGAWVMNMVQLPVLAVLVFLPALRLPRIMAPAVMVVSAASYHIYLFHRIIPEALGLDAMGPLGITASLLIGLAAGLAAAALQRVVFAGLGRRAGLAARNA